MDDEGDWEECTGDDGMTIRYNTTTGEWYEVTAAIEEALESQRNLRMKDGAEAKMKDYRRVRAPHYDILTTNCARSRMSLSRFALMN